MIGDDDDEGDEFGEHPQRPFQPDSSSNAHTSLQLQVLQCYGYRCALTGAQFGPPQLYLHPDLDVVFIQPREQGGPLSINNYLPMLYSLVSPFKSGLIYIDEDFRIRTPHPDMLDGELISALRASLVLPEVPFRPGDAFLAHHRRYALGR